MFGLDKMTLKRYIDKVKKTGPDAKVGYSSVSLAHSIFNPAIQKDLANHLAKLSDQYHGLSLDKAKELAYEFALQNKLKIPDFWILDKKAGRGWWIGFKKNSILHYVRQKQLLLDVQLHLTSTMQSFVLIIWLMFLTNIILREDKFSMWMKQELQ